MSAPEPAATREVVDRARALLGPRFPGCAPAVVEAYQRPRSRIWRLRLREGDGSETTVIAKQAYDPHPPPSGMSDATARFHDEWSSLAFLEKVCGSASPGPALLAADPEARLVLMEDLGDAGCVTTTLMGRDASRAATAIEAYGAALGRLHAASLGRKAELDVVRSSLGIPAKEVGAGARSALTGDIEAFLELCDGRGLGAAPLAEDLARVGDLLATSGPFLALTHGDPCPDNAREISGEVRLFDFEGAEYRHCLLEGVYPLVLFPTCWCIGQLPTETVTRAMDAYQRELRQRLPLDVDDGRLEEGVVAAVAYWTLTGAALVPHAERAGAVGLLREIRRRDWEWGRATARDRFLSRLEVLATVSRRSGALRALGDVGVGLASCLKEEWGPSTVAAYPAFAAR